MNRDDIQKLLGGYGTGTLTPEEQQALFEAALNDQELFDALAREQALRDLLRDPAAKAHLLAALDHRPPRWYERLVRGWRPLAAAVAMAGVAAIAVVVVRQSTRAPQPVIVAQVSPPPAAADTSSTPPAVVNPASIPLAATNPAPEPPAMGDTNARTMRDTDAPARRLAKESPAKVPAGPEGVSEEDRRANVKREAQVSKRKEVAGSVTGTPSVLKGEAVPLPAPPPIPPRTLTSGIREGAMQGGVGGNLGGMPPASQPQPPAEPKAAPLSRSAPGKAFGGAVGGVVGGVLGAAPPAPATVAPPKAEAQSSQSAQSQGVPSQTGPSQAKQSQAAPLQSIPSQSAQGQQGAPSQSAPIQSAQGQPGAPSQFEQLRSAQQPAAVAAETVQVQATAASLDALSSQDARSLFYGNSVGSPSFNAPGAGGGVAGSGGYASAQTKPAATARKKTAEQPEKTQAQRPGMVVSAIAGGPRSVQTFRLPNLGVRYSLLRKTATGGFEPVDPDSVKTGDTLKLQLMPNFGGTLSVRGRSGDGPWREVMSRSVEARKTYTTPLKSGEKELQVMLTRLPVAVTGAALRDGKSGADVSQQSTTEPATYVVASPASQQLHFTITLNYK